MKKGIVEQIETLQGERIAILNKNSNRYYKLVNYQEQHLQATNVVIEDQQRSLTVAAAVLIGTRLKKKKFEDFLE